MAEIQRLKEEGAEKTLQSLLGSRLVFGTAGLRAKMGAGYCCINDLTIIQTTQVSTPTLALSLSSTSDGYKVLIASEHIPWVLVASVLVCLPYLCPLPLRFALFVVLWHGTYSCLAACMWLHGGLQCILQWVGLELAH